jgi:hypothetical protein
MDKFELQTKPYFKEGLQLISRLDLNDDDKIATVEFLHHVNERRGGLAGVAHKELSYRRVQLGYSVSAVHI